jgi:hypothetical protein
MWSKTISAAAVLSLAAACGSSSSEPLAVEMQGVMGDTATPAELSGPAVDDGVVCPTASTEVVGYEDLDGNSLTEAEFNENSEVAMETGEITVGAIYVEYTCEDASGTFVMKQLQTVVPSEFDFEAMNEDVGTWAIDRGTDAYEELTGEGSIDFDFANGLWICAGDLTN